MSAFVYLQTRRNNEVNQHDDTCLDDSAVPGAGGSKRAYPRAPIPRGISRSTKKRAIRSYSTLPISSSDTFESSTLSGLYRLNKAETSRCLSGDEGVVNWKTAGAVIATETPL